MFKSRLIFSLFIAMIPVIFFKATDLYLSYFIYSTFLLFFCSLLYLEQDRILFRAAVGLFAMMDLLNIFREKSYEAVGLIIVHALVLGCLVYYRKSNFQKLKTEINKNDEILKEWETLKKKHQNRLENLRHLEKQSASLMDLYEMASDFNECLSFAVLTEQLSKNVKAEMPFKEMLLIIENTPEDLTVYKIGSKTAKQIPQVEATDLEMMTTAKAQRKVLMTDGIWMFPLFIKKEFLGYLKVEGAQADDLAKFEVLSAHLVLQIKKIGLYETVKNLSIVDGLTKVFVRRHFMELCEQEIKRCQKRNFPMTLLMLDIDHFKRYNDDFGHLVGDATLREVAFILRKSLRTVDIVARYGGEEFIIVIPETGVKGALEAAERIRSNIARHVYHLFDVSTRVTASIGLVVFPDDCSKEDTSSFDANIIHELINKADEALYRAKEEGRNRVVKYQDLSEAGA